MKIFGFLLSLIGGVPLLIFAILFFDIALTTRSPAFAVVPFCFGMGFLAWGIVPIIASTPWVRYLNQNFVR